MGYVGNIISGGDTHLVASTLYGVCSTVASTAAKVVTLADYDALITGTTIHVKFQYSNTAASPTLNVNGTGDVPIYVDGVNAPGITALTSWQANSMVSFTYDGTAWRMNDNNMSATNAVSSLLNLVYPVGAIYMSVNSTSPATLFGGTWEQLQNRFLLAAGSSYSAGATGGEASHTLTTGEMPSHTHTGPSHSHGLNSHTHTLSHTHTVPAHNHGLNSHTHGLNGHTHSIPSLSGTATNAGSHGHRTWFNPRVSGRETCDWGFKWDNSGSKSVDAAPGSSGIEYSAAHTHAVTTVASTTGGNSGSTAAASGSTANSSTLTSGAASTSTTSAATGSTAAGGTGATGSAGSGSAHNNMPPYLAVYMWKRVS